MDDVIWKRKSMRKYAPEQLDAAALESVRAKIGRLTPLYSDIRYAVNLVSKIKIPMKINAPHFLLFSSEEKDGAYENIGFIGQQMSLFFTESGLGSCWLGMAKPEEKEETALPFVIAMAFGKPAEPLYRAPGDFKRKPLAQISEGDDPRLEAARLAPSAVNFQNWYFIAAGGKIHCYCKKPNAVLGMFTHGLELIDIGIAVWHIAAESEHFDFIKDKNPPARKGCIYIGTTV